MRSHVVNAMISTISKAAEDAGLSQHEMMLVLASTMAELMENMGSNLMDVSMDEKTLVVGLRKNDATTDSDDSSKASVH